VQRAHHLEFTKYSTFETHFANSEKFNTYLLQKYGSIDTHLLVGVGIHTLSITVDGECQPAMVMVPYFTTKQSRHSMDENHEMSRNCIN